MPPGGRVREVYCGSFFLFLWIYRVSWLCFYSVDVCEDLLADPVDCVSIFLSRVLFFCCCNARPFSLKPCTKRLEKGQYCLVVVIEVHVPVIHPILYRILLHMGMTNLNLARVFCSISSGGSAVLLYYGWKPSRSWCIHPSSSSHFSRYRTGNFFEWIRSLWRFQSFSAAMRLLCSICFPLLAGVL